MSFYVGFHLISNAIQVNGERAPTEVYKDFRISILDILGAQDNQEALLNGVAGMGKGMNEIPGSIVSVETAPSQHKNVITAAAIDESSLNAQQRHSNSLMGQQTTSTDISPISLRHLPPIICIIGGPGSNKAMLCLKAIALLPGWGHFR